MKKIRIGILLNTYHIPLWEHKLLQELIASKYASINLIVLNNNKVRKKTLIQKMITSWQLISYFLYIKLDTKLFSVKRNAFEIIDTNELLSSVNTLKVKTKSTKFSDRFYDKDIELIKKENLDILVRFGFGILRGDILKVAKYGVWSYHHGDNLVNRGGPAGFWEVIENVPVTGSILQILTEDLDAGTVLSRSYSKTDKISIIRNKNNYYWKSASLLPRKIRELYELGEEAFFKKVDEENIYPSFYSQRLYSKRNFGNFNMLILFVKHWFRILKNKFLKKFFLEQWTLLFTMKDGVSSSFWKFKKIIPPKDRFYADPFLVAKNNKYYVFLEEYIYTKGIGHISVIEMNENGEYSKPIKVLEHKKHLSYPHIIEDNNEYFMIPENRGNKSVDLYKCIDFPYKWEFHLNIMKDIEAVDATVFVYNNKYWLFCNIMENGGASTYDELYLFHADSLVTNHWTPHPLNPIVSDVRKARPAGNIFVHKGKIIRPAQNCSEHYGYGMNMNEILILNEKEYKETSIESITPDWDKNAISTHTFNHVDGLTFIDAKYRRYR